MERNRSFIILFLSWVNFWVLLGEKVHLVVVSIHLNFFMLLEIFTGNLLPYRYQLVTIYTIHWIWLFGSYFISCRIPNYCLKISSKMFSHISTFSVIFCLRVHNIKTQHEVILCYFYWLLLKIKIYYLYVQAQIVCLQV